MPEPTPTPTPEPAPAPEPPRTPEADPVDQTDDVAALRSEAASRRRALRAVEAERDQLRERLNERDRQAVERLAGERLNDAADLWLSTSLDAMRAEDGTIDMEKAEAEVERVLGEKPHWRKPAPLPRDMFPQGVRQPVEEPKSPSFGESVKQALRRG